jgi:hypothetical protein
VWVKGHARTPEVTIIIRPFVRSADLGCVRRAPRRPRHVSVASAPQDRGRALPAEVRGGDEIGSRLERRGVVKAEHGGLDGQQAQQEEANGGDN